MGPAVTSTKMNRLEEMKYGVKHKSKTYGSDHVLVVVAEIVAIVVHIGVLIHGWKHVRFGWLHENDLYFIQLHCTYGKSFRLLVLVATACQFQY